MNPIIDYVERNQIKKNLPLVRVGDLVRLDVKIVEGEDQRTRLASLTVQGERAVTQAYGLWKAAQDRFLVKFGKEGWRHTRADLAAVASAMRLDR